MILSLNLTIDIPDGIVFDKNDKDQVIWFLEDVLVPKNLQLYSTEIEDNVGVIKYIKDIIEL
jgi:hypothetical protein